MLMQSLRFFTNFENEYEEKLAVHPAGFLLLNQSSQAQFLDHVIYEARQAGCTAQRISGAQAIELQPGLRQDSDDIYAFEPDAIYVDPMLATQALARTARRLGVEIVEGCEIRSILKDGSQILGVETSLGKIESRSVGDWDGRLGRRAARQAGNCCSGLSASLGDDFLFGLARISGTGGSDFE